MKQYEKYKDSKVAWLGQIPEHWQDVRLAGCFSEVKETNKDSELDRAFQFKYGNIVYKKDTPIDAEAIATFKKYAKVNENDIVVNGLNLNYDFLTQRVAIVHQRGIITSAYITMTPRDIIVPKFACYLLKGIDEKKLLNGMGTGIRLTLSFGELKKQYIPYPSVVEQEQIVRYLDWKVAMADKFVREKRREITLLKELRQAEINRAVTRGLDHTAPTKPSGIGWIGDIPKHWKTSKIKYLADLKSGTNLTSNQIDTEGDYPVYGGNGLRGYYHSFSNDGDYVLIGRQGALCGNINYANGKFWATEHAVICYPKTYLKSIWFGELLRSMNLNQYSIASAQPGLAVERIKNLGIPHPPISEQQQIVEHIKIIEANINKAIEKIEAEISLTAEYKTRLISDVTTGKVDVRGIEIPDYTIEEGLSISDNEKIEE